MMEIKEQAKAPAQVQQSTDFIHLHLHTEYSLLDGAIRIKDLPSRLKELNMQACALTDHGVLFGAIDFYEALTAKGIKPILGAEVYVAPRKHTDKEVSFDKEPAHLILLAENNQGYRNLMKLVSLGFIDGFYYKPRIDHELLIEYHEGIIALSACLSGEIPKAILAGDMAEAKRLAELYSDLFGRDNFFLELQENGLPDQDTVNQSLLQISRELKIRTVATNDCHYLQREDATAHEVLLCMQTGKQMNDPDRMRMDSDSFYLKSKEEMKAAFAYLPEALANTVEIANRCNVTLDFDSLHLPSFDTPAGISSDAFMRELCFNGLKKRLKIEQEEHEELIPIEYKSRLEHELKIISEMGYTDYYLIVWDFIRFAHEKDIIVGPGRGSGAGSLAAWCLWITDIDPIKYGLIFERFLNVERVSMPDFDIDFCYERRQEVMDYVVDKYGKEKVAQVITFGTLAARACIRDVGRALDVSYAQRDKIAKMVPATLGITLEKALAVNRDLALDYQNNETTKEIIDLAMKFEGMPRHASTHAAGVVIANRPLTELVPLARNEEAIVVQFAKNNIEKIGLLKFDFLGLRTLTVLRETVDLIKKQGGPSIAIDKINMNDAHVFSLISEGKTEGVFQLESPGMTSFMKELKPESLEDIIAGISLYRPGPMEQIPRYVTARHDLQKIRYDHPLLEPILNVTYGCIVYQEQVMQIVRDLAGFSLAQSDNVRRAMSKKQPEELARYRKLFLFGGQDEKGRQVPGAVARGVSPGIAEKIFDEVMAFAGYAFNKSHAAAYAVVAYYTGWFKYYYPVEFMAAMLNGFLGNLSQAAYYVNACHKMNIQVLPPDINKSQIRFQPEGKAIRFALAAVKNVGEAAVAQLIHIREEDGLFVDYGDFLRRLSSTGVNKKMIESLVRSSALDGFGLSRVKMIAVIEPYLRQLAQVEKNSMIGQLSLFEMDGATENAVLEPSYPNLPEYTGLDLLKMEKEMLGLYVTGHPLNDYNDKIKELITADSSLFSHNDDNEERLELTSAKSYSDSSGNHAQETKFIIMAGIVADQREFITKKNETMSFVQIEDRAGTFEMIVFSKLYAARQHLLLPDSFVLVSGKVSVREDEAPKLIAEEIADLNAPLVELKKIFGGKEVLAKTVEKGSIKNKEDKPEHANTSKSGTKNKFESNKFESTIVIKYDGKENDDGYNRLIALLKYFQGESPVKIFLPGEDRLIELSSDCWLSAENNILREVASRYGSENIALL